MDSVERWDRIATLVRRARRGDGEAFAELLRLHADSVTATLLACGVRSRDTARELAQEAAVRAWRALGRLEDPRAFPAWFRRIAANTARDHLRRAAVRGERGLEEAMDLVAEDDPHASTERRDELRLMLAALEAEDEASRDLILARADGAGIAELARRTGLSEGAVKMRLLRIRQRLRRRLAALRDGGGAGAS